MYVHSFHFLLSCLPSALRHLFMVVCFEIIQQCPSISILESKPLLFICQSLIEFYSIVDTSAI